MNISAVVELADGTFLLACGEGDVSVPPDPANRHFQAIQRWIADGGVIKKSPEPEPVVPQVVSRFQARAALHVAGLLPQVEALMADPDTDMLARLAWTDAREFRRDSPTIASMSGLLGITQQQLDDLFVMAATIEA